MIQALLGAAAVLGRGVAAVGGAVARGAGAAATGVARGAAGAARGAAGVAEGAAGAAESGAQGLSRGARQGLKSAFSSGHGGGNNDSSTQSPSATMGQSTQPSNNGAQDLAGSIAQHASSAVSSRQGF